MNMNDTQTGLSDAMDTPGSLCDTLPEQIAPTIRTIRDQKVMLDRDLAALYGVAVKRLNEQVRRNRARFPEDFLFQLTEEEAETAKRLRSQFATLKRGQHRKYTPYAFTEHGAIMAAMVLNSPQAVQMSVFVVRAFVMMREHLATTRELARRLAEIEKQLVVHDTALVKLYEKIRPLLLPPEAPPPKQIGFAVKEPRVRYGSR